MENINNIEQLLNEVHTISESYERVAEATGENFNIFSIMRMESDEVKTHSRFIAELLNPKGRHGQKDKFLKFFLKIIDTIDFTTENVKVYVEYHVGKIMDNKEEGGRLDILLKNGKGNIIMIENKIYADDQPNQLLRYQNAFPNGKLLYLTLDGRESDQETSKQIKYQTISYRKQITDWLVECKKESADTPILRESVSQYINLIKKLTHQNINTKMNQDLISKVLRDKNTFTSFKALVNIKDEVFIYVLNQKLITLVNEVVNESNGEIQLEFSIDPLLDYSHKWKRISFVNDQLRSINLCLCFSFAVPKGYRNFVYGFHYLKEEIDTKKHDQLKLEFNNTFTQYQSSPWWPCYNVYEGYQDWEDTEILEKIIFEDDFNTDFKKKVQEMLEIIEKVHPKIVPSQPNS